MTVHKKWYHYGMISLKVMFLTAVVFLVVTSIQLGVAQKIESEIIEFSGACSTEWATDNDKVDGILAANCDNTLVNLPYSQEALFLHSELTSSVKPVIICVNTVTEYTKTKSWDCEIGTNDIK